MTRALETGGNRRTEGTTFRAIESYTAHVPVLTRPVIVGTPSFFPAPNTAATALTISIPTPAGAAIGESLLVSLHSSGLSDSDCTIPSGWARIGLPVINDPGVRMLGWFIHKLTATPAASYSFTAPASGRFGGVMYRVQNAHTTQPLCSGFQYGARTGASVETKEMDIDDGNPQPTEDSLLLISVITQQVAGNTTVPTNGPAGMTALTATYFGTDAGSRTGCYIWRENRSAGRVAPQTITYAVAPAAGASNSIVLRGVYV